jgi:hypothetical protein
MFSMELFIKKWSKVTMYSIFAALAALLVFLGFSNNKQGQSQLTNDESSSFFVEEANADTPHYNVITSGDDDSAPVSSGDDDDRDSADDDGGW